MSESSIEGGSVAPNIKKRLAEEPFYIQRLGLAAVNAGMASEFQTFLNRGDSPKQLYGAVLSELQQQGIPDAEELLEKVFEVPNLNN